MHSVLAGSEVRPGAHPDRTAAALALPAELPDGLPVHLVGGGPQPGPAATAFDARCSGWMVAVIRSTPCSNNQPTRAQAASPAKP